MSHRHRGQPTKYQPDYPQQVVEFCSQGYSLTAFAAHIQVARDTITEWQDSHPEFSAAVSRAKAARLEFFEQAALGMISAIGDNRPTGGQASLLTFLMKNVSPEEYRDRQEVTHNVGITIEQLLVKADEQRPEPKDVTPNANTNEIKVLDHKAG